MVGFVGMYLLMDGHKAKSTKKRSICMAMSLVWPGALLCCIAMAIFIFWEQKWTKEDSTKK